MYQRGPAYVDSEVRPKFGTVLLSTTLPALLVFLSLLLSLHALFLRLQALLLRLQRRLFSLQALLSLRSLPKLLLSPLDSSKVLYLG